MNRWTMKSSQLIYQDLRNVPLLFLELSQKHTENFWIHWYLNNQRKIVSFKSPKSTHFTFYVLNVFYVAIGPVNCFTPFRKKEKVIDLFPVKVQIYWVNGYVGILLPSTCKLHYVSICKRFMLTYRISGYLRVMFSPRNRVLNISEWIFHEIQVRVERMCQINTIAFFTNLIFSRT